MDSISFLGNEDRLEADSTIERIIHILSNYGKNEITYGMPERTPDFIFIFYTKNSSQNICEKINKLVETLDQEFIERALCVFNNDEKKDNEIINCLKELGYDIIFRCYDNDVDAVNQIRNFIKTHRRVLNRR